MATRLIPPGLLLLAASALSACTSPASDLDGAVHPVELSRECAPGWQSAEAGSACDAVLPDEECPAGTMPVIGDKSCQAVFPMPCPAGFVADPSGWGCSDVMPAAVCEGATREEVGHVDCQPVGDCAAAFPPGDATHFVNGAFTAAQLDATHFKSIGAAVAAAPAGAVVAIESGTYSESLTLDRAVSLVGRCPAQVVLQAPAGTGVPGVKVSSGASTLRGLTVKGHFNGTIVVAGAELTVEDAVYDSNLILGLLVEGKGTVRRSVFRDSIAEAGDWGLGMKVRAGGQAALTSVALSRNAESALVVQGTGSAVTLDGVVARQTRPRGDGTNGYGLTMIGSVTADVRHSVFADNTEMGVYVDNIGGVSPSLLTLTDSVVRDTRNRAVGMPDPLHPGFVDYFGSNLYVVGKAAATVTGSSLLRARGASLVVGLSATMTVDQSLIRETRPFPDGYQTSGAIAQSGGLLHLKRSAVVGAAGNGIDLYGAGTKADLTGCVVADSHRVGTSSSGQGVALQAGAYVEEATRSAVTGSDATALVIGTSLGGASPGTAFIQDSVLSHSRGYADGSFGRGIEVWSGGGLLMTRSAVTDHREVGIVVADPGSAAVIGSSVVRDIAGDGNGLVGRGINVQSGGHLELVDTLVLRSHDVGVMIGMAGSTGQFTFGAIAHTLSRVADNRFGFGVASVADGRLSILSTRIAESGQIGVVVDHAGATLRQATLAKNPVALHAQSGSTVTEVSALPADPGPLDVLVTDDTVFLENAVRLGEGSVPLPPMFGQ